MEVNLQNLLDGKFRFYLINEYRKQIFLKLKNIYNDWGLVAKSLGIDRRNLFGIRRGWELREEQKKLFLINANTLKNIINLLNLNLNEVSKNITIVKLGISGRNSKIKLPFKINLTKTNDLHTVKRALLDYVLMKERESNINLSYIPTDLIIKNKYFTIYPKIDNILENLRLRGLKPTREEYKYYYEFSYRVPGTNKRTAVRIPKEITFNEYFAKEFGKWLGDRCGGISKLGVANKNWIFIKEFKEFLHYLNQQYVDLYLTCKSNFNPEENIKSNVNRVVYSKTQFGDYAYRVEVSNKIFKDLVFDILENNIFNILYHSKSSVRYAFYAGYFEAEGSIIKNSYNLSFSFGINLQNKKFHSKMNSLLEKIIKFKYLLTKDNFNPRISRKVSRTKNTNILKYDIILLHSEKTRAKEIKFIKKTIYPYLSHDEKIQKFDQLEVNCCGTNKY